MGKSIFKRTAAIICSAAAVAALSVSAFAEVKRDEMFPNYEQSVDDVAEQDNIWYADRVTAKPGEEVKYGIHLKNNTGFRNSGFLLYYNYMFDADGQIVDINDNADKAKLVCTPDPDNEDKPDNSKGEVIMNYNARGDSNPLSLTTALNPDISAISCGTIGEKTAPNDGDIVFFYFQVPEDAQIGDKYAMSLAVTELGLNNQSIDNRVAISGWIEIVGDDTTTSTTDTTTTTTETTTSTTTTDTTTSTTTTETTTSTTTTETTTSTTTTETTTSTTTTETTTSTTTTETTTSTTTTETTTSTTTTETTTSTTTTETTTSTTTTETTTSTTTTETTTSTTTTETTTSTTTTTSGSTDTTTTTTTTSGSSSSTTTTTTGAPIASSGSVTTTTPAKGAATGDAGVGVAVAGLLMAAGTAVVLATKKKED